MGWRGQKTWQKEFARLQYQAVRKATGAVQGTAIDKVNRMAGTDVSALAIVDATSIPALQEAAVRIHIGTPYSCFPDFFFPRFRVIGVLFNSLIITPTRPNVHFFNFDYSA